MPNNSKPSPGQNTGLSTTLEPAPQTPPRDQGYNPLSEEHLAQLVASETNGNSPGGGTGSDMHVEKMKKQKRRFQKEMNQTMMDGVSVKKPILDDSASHWADQQEPTHSEIGDHSVYTDDPASIYDPLTDVNGLPLPNTNHTTPEDYFMDISAIFPEIPPLNTTENTNSEQLEWPEAIIIPDYSLKSKLEGDITELSQNDIIQEAGQLEILRLTPAIFSAVKNRLEGSLRCSTCGNKEGWNILKQSDDQYVAKCRSKTYHVRLGSTTACESTVPLHIFWANLIKVDVNRWVENLSALDTAYINSVMWNNKTKKHRAPLKVPPTQTPAVPQPRTTTVPPLATDHWKKALMDIQSTVRAASRDPSKHARTLHSMAVQLLQLVDEQAQEIRQLQQRKPQASQARQSYSQIVSKNIPTSSTIGQRANAALTAAEQKASPQEKAEAANKILQGLHPTTNQPLAPKPPVYRRMLPDTAEVANPALKEIMETSKLVRIHNVKRTSYKILKSTLKLKGIDMTKVLHISYLRNNVVELLLHPSGSDECIALLQNGTSGNPQKEIWIETSDNPVYNAEAPAESQHEQQNAYIRRAAHICLTTNNLATAMFYQHQLKSPELQKKLHKTIDSLSRAAGTAGRLHE